MRTLSVRMLACGCLAAGCLSTQDVSLGELPAAAGLDAGPDVGASLDARDGAEGTGDERDVPSMPDAAAEGGRDSDAALRDEGGATDASNDARADAEQGSADAAKDASSSDAGDGNVPLICILEPWHCR